MDGGTFGSVAGGIRLKQAHYAEARSTSANQFTGPLQLPGAGGLRTLESAPCPTALPLPGPSYSLPCSADSSHLVLACVPGWRSTWDQASSFHRNLNPQQMHLG